MSQIRSMGSAEARFAAARELLRRQQWAELLAFLDVDVDVDVDADGVEPPGLLNIAGIAALQLGKPALAEACWRAALRQAPDYADAHNNLGNLRVSQGRDTEAEAAYRAALAARPEYPEAIANLRALLEGQQRLDELEAAYRDWLAARPGWAIGHNNFGDLLLSMQRPEDAEAEFRIALAQQPGYVDAHYNLGLALANQQRFDAAERHYRTALRLRPGMADARWNLAMLLLLQGRLVEAWPYYEARCDADLARRVVVPPALPFPRWRGEDLAGRSILIWPEQGHGDQLQFVRYLPLLRRRGARRITLICNDALHGLFEHSGLADVVLAKSEVRARLQRHDFWVLLGSLPGCFGSTLYSLPAELPYLRVPEEALPSRSVTGERQVGIVWRGNPRHPNDANRSVPDPAALAPLWEVPGVRFHSLQVDDAERTQGNPVTSPAVVDLAPGIRDFSDTARLIAGLDLVISVDTATAHLAGALARPVWLLLPRVDVDWRWMLDRDDSPWYPGVMRIFRQPRAGDWAGLARELAVALRAWVDRPA